MHTTSKVEHIRQALVKQIEQGNLSRGGLLPSERQLAVDFGVSHMTARKAIDLLVAGNYLERRPGIGTFVRSDLDERKARKQLGIMVPAWETPEFADIILYTSRIAELNNWLPKVFYCRFWQDRVFEEALEQCDALMVMPPESLDRLPPHLLRRFTEGSVPVVLTGSPGYVLGIDSLTGPSGMPLALDRLIHAGHRKIAMILQKFNDKEKLNPYQIYIDEWRHRVEPLVKPEELSSLLLELEVPRFELPHRVLQKTILKCCRDHSGVPFTAMIVPVSIAWGAIRGLHDAGLRIPDDVSIVVTGDRQEAEFYCPRFDMVRISTADIVAKAWDMVQARLAGERSRPLTRQIYPEMIYGETVKNITKPEDA